MGLNLIPQNEINNTNRGLSESVYTPMLDLVCTTRMHMENNQVWISVELGGLAHGFLWLWKMELWFSWMSLWLGKVYFMVVYRLVIPVMVLL